MKRRSFLQTIMAAIVGLPRVRAGEHIFGGTVEIIKRNGDGSYSWQEVTLESDRAGRLLSWTVKPGGRFGVAGECDQALEIRR